MMLRRNDRNLENIPVGALGLIALDGCTEMGEMCIRESSCIDRMCNISIFPIHSFLARHCNKESLPVSYTHLLRHKSFRINITNSDYSLIASFNALPALNFGALQAAIFIVSPV